MNKRDLFAVSIPGVIPNAGVTDINPLKTLMVVSLQKEGPFEPEQLPKDKSTSLSKVFEHTKPSVTVQLDSGAEKKPETIHFKNLKSFQPKEIIKRVEVLQELNFQEQMNEKLNSEVQKSANLRKLFDEKERRTAFAELLRTIKEEIESAK